MSYTEEKATEKTSVILRHTCMNTATTKLEVHDINKKEIKVTAIIHNVGMMAL